MPKIINTPNYKVDPNLYTRQYYLDPSYAGADLYKEGLYDLAPSVKYIWSQIRPGNNQQLFLDAGCGKGELMLFMSKKGYRVSGIDYSKTAVRMTKSLMKKNHVKAQVILGDVRHVPLGDGSVDVIISTDLVEHLDDNAATIDFLNECYRLLKPNGRLYIHTAPNKLFVEGFFRFYMRYIQYFVIAINNMFTNKKKPKTLELRTSYERQMHVNEQTWFSIRRNLSKSKFTDFKINLFGEPFDFSVLKLPYYVLVYLFPVNRVFPLTVFLANHIYISAIK